MGHCCWVKGRPNNSARGFEQASHTWSGASFWGNKRCMSQQTRITIVELVHGWPLADLVQLANFTVKRVNFSFLSWEKLVLSLVDGKRRNLALVSDFVSWDSASLVPRHKITHSCKIPPLSIHSWWNLYFQTRRVCSKFIVYATCLTLLLLFARSCLLKYDYYAWY